MPPSIVLEVLRITEAEMDLRDLTRETEQARPATLREEYDEAVETLTLEQADLVDRTDWVIEDILDLPNAEQDFGRELKSLRDAVVAMREAEEELRTPSTGPVVVAAETEAIEHLLQSRRAGGGGGGGGSSPGKGDRSGDTNVSALALAGRSLDADADVNEREVSDAGGGSENPVPEELRRGLDRYFEKLNGSGSR